MPLRDERVEAYRLIELARPLGTAHDQPVRLDALVTKRHGRWQLGARLQIASGLPTTAIQQSVYDADRDSYRPIFDRIYGERLPTRVEVDLRIDRSFRLTARTRLDAFLDLQLSPSTIGYDVSFDYKQRRAVTLPILPFAGLRGRLWRSSLSFSRWR